MSEEVAAKHQLEESLPQVECPKAKRARGEEAATEAPMDRLAQTKRQIEYYLSNENLQYDAYFQKIISANEEGWMPFATVLSCKRIQQLDVGVAEIKEALKDSTAVEVKPVESEVPEENFLRRANNEPLPTLTERRPRKSGANNKENNNQQRVFDQHAAGCLIKIENIPEEVSWESVKALLSERLPAPTEKPQKPEEIAAGKKPFVEYPIRFVSTPTSTGVCYAHLTPFQDDQSIIKGWAEKPLIINGQEVSIKLIDDYTECMAFLKSMPTVLQRRRERDLVKRKQELNSKPVSLGGHEFASLDHLKKCLKEVLIDVPAGKAVNSATGGVLRALLAYHHNGKKKLEGCTGFKVDLNDKVSKNRDDEQTRCFYVVREDGTFEDFSLQKCFAAIARNPPFVEKPASGGSSEPNAESKNAQPTEAPTAETTTPAAASEAVSETQEA